MSNGNKGNGPANGPGSPSEPNRVAEPQLAEEEFATEEDTIPDLEAALENARAELSQSTDRFLRLAAEFDNYKKRTDRERVEAYGRAQSDLVARMLEALDDLERVADFDANTPSASLLEGVQLVEKKLRTVLSAAGLEPVEAKGATFDPNTMEAIATTPAEHPEEDEVVSDVFQTGYKFKGQLIRPARVRVKQFEE